MVLCVPAGVAQLAEKPIIPLHIDKPIIPLCIEANLSKYIVTLLQKARKSNDHECWNLAHQPSPISWSDKGGRRAADTSVEINPLMDRFP